MLKAFAQLGFVVARVGNHIGLEHRNEEGTTTPITLPNHRTLKSSTLRTILTQAGISREDFLEAYDTV